MRNGGGSRRKTRGWLVATGGVLALVALAFWRPIQEECIAYLLLHSDAPSEEVLSDTVEQTKDPSALLRRLWNTEKLPHRQFVAGYLSRVSTAKPELFRNWSR